MRIENKTIVVTGGASGLGRATVEHLLGYDGTSVAIFDLNEEAGQDAEKQLGSDRVGFFPVNVVEPGQVQEAVAGVVGKFGGVDVCINCAGIGTPAKILSRDGSAVKGVDHFAKVINVNLIGTYNVMAFCLEEMAKNDLEDGEERGVIINTSSGAAYEGQVGQAGYASSKAALIGLNLPAAREFGDYGVRINAIAPGLFLTPMAQQLDQKIIDRLTANAQGPKRLGRMEEFAECCAFLIQNSYMNADTVRLDAGARLAPR